jgi:Chlorophyll A-B binding protein
MTHVRIEYASTSRFDSNSCSLVGFFAIKITMALSVNVAEWNFWGVSEEARVGFLRHSEIKHGRIAMFAFVGYIAHANGFKFPWPMQLDGTPFPDELNPPLLWDKIPDGAKWQIIGFIGFLEYWGELSTPEHTHYMMPGGKPGKYPDFIVGPNGIPHPVGFNLYDPLKLWKKRSEEAKARGLLVEINNGRAAMFGILGFLSAQSVPGSVPLLNKVLPAYYGEVMMPFEPALTP